MPYQLHTRAGLAPPYQTTDKRFLNTGSGGAAIGSGVIADGFAGSQIVIELETVLGEYNTVQSATLNYLLHGAITNTSANNYAGIHWLSDGKIRAIAGASIATRSVTSANSYATGDFVKIRWVLSFASVTSGLVGTQELFINDVSQGTNNARSDQFATAGGRFALNSVCANDNSVQVDRITDQYIRRFYINYADGGYEREWVFDQSTGFEVPNSASATIDPLKLFGGNGINVLGDNWPSDNSQWVFYGSAGTNYDTGAISSAEIVTTGDTQRNTDASAVSQLSLATTGDTQRSTDVGAVSQLSLTATGLVKRSTTISATSSFTLTTVGDTQRDTTTSATSSFTLTMTGGSLGPRNFDTGAISSVAITTTGDTQRNTTAGAVSSLTLTALADSIRNTAVSATSSFTLTMTGGDDSDKPVISVIRFNSAIIRSNIRLGAGRVSGPLRFEAGKTIGVIRWS